MNGAAIGLNYASLFELIDRKGYAGEAWWQMFDDIRTLEGAALEAMLTD